jgi:uncharacterized protein
MMFTNLSETSKAWVFAGLACTLALLAGIAIRVLEVTSEFAGALIYMSTPTLAAVVMLLVVTRDGRSRSGWKKLGLRRSHRRTWPLAVVATFLASLLASAAVWITPLAGFHPPHGAVDELINFMINAVLMALTIVLGEELGWRGYLLPRLRGIGRNRSLFAVGLVHATWHLPLIFLTSLYHSDGNKMLVLSLFTATLVAASYAFGYLRLATGSVWPATVAHAVHNAAWGLLGAFTATSHPVVVEEYLAGDNGALILGTTILAAWSIRLRLTGRTRARAARTAMPAGRIPAA